MNTGNSWKNGNLFHTLAALVTMSAFLFLVAAPRAQADERDRCRHRIEKAEVRLSHAVARFGERSPEARARWHELRAERERCWEAYHQWWDTRDRRWHTERDWDRDDRWPDEHEHEHEHR